MITPMPGQTIHINIKVLYTIDRAIKAAMWMSVLAEAYP
jgi:hypothetical protein